MSTTSQQHPSRGIWSSKLEFLLTCLGNGAGYTRIVAFPYICYSYGGGTFLIPYFIMLAYFAAPLLYMEIAVGQLTKLGPMHAIGILCPLLKGVGIAIVIISAWVSTYYITFTAWAFQYFFNSFKSPLPWTLCDQAWNTAECISGAENESEISSATVPPWEYEYVQKETPSQQYFNNHVLQLSNDIDGLGGLSGRSVGYFILAWALCYVCIFKGVRSAGKVAYVTTLLPYVLLFALLVRNLTLPGATEGLHFLFVPDARHLLNPKVWIFAAYQAFNCVGITLGSTIVLSSYNARRNNIYLDTVLISVVGGITSLIAACVVFSALGALAYKHEISISEVVTAGWDTAFISIPSLLADLPGSNGWTAVFFLMLICFGISTQFPYVQVIITSVLDQFQDKLKNVTWRKELVALVVCVACFILGLPCITRAGKHMVTFYDIYAYAPMPYVTFFEIMAICWFYGGNRLAREIGFSSGYRPYYFIPFVWVFVCPVLVTALAWYQFTNIFYFGFYFGWRTIIGSLISLFCFMWIPGGALHELYKNGQGKSFCTSLFTSVTPLFVGEYVLRKRQATSDTRVGRPNEGNEGPSTVVQPLILQPTNLPNDDEANTTTRNGLPDVETKYDEEKGL